MPDDPRREAPIQWAEDGRERSLTGSTPAEAAPADPLRGIDAALIGLRHLWSAPPRLDDPQLGRVEMSTVWVAEALARPDAGEATVNDVAAELDVAQSTASRLVDRAERAGVVTRSRSSRDARRVVLSLTPVGHTLAARSSTFRLEYLNRVTADWSLEERRTFADLLTRFASSVHRTPPGRDQP